MTFRSFVLPLAPLFALSSNLWEELSDAAGLIIAALFILAGGLIGFVLRWLIGRWQADSIEKSGSGGVGACRGRARARGVRVVNRVPSRRSGAGGGASCRARKDA